jgi:hypothetical protein
LGLLTTRMEPPGGRWPGAVNRRVGPGEAAMGTSCMGGVGVGGVMRGVVGGTSVVEVFPRFALVLGGFGDFGGLAAFLVVFFFFGFGFSLNSSSESSSSSSDYLVILF